MATQIVYEVAFPHRFSVEDVTAMAEAGIIDADLRTELVDGVLIEMTPPGPRHAGVVSWLTRQLVIAAGDRYEVRVQDVLLTPDRGYRSPDLMVIEPSGRDRLPDAAVLIVEIAHTSCARDRGKAAIYAAAGVPEYWIVDVGRNEVLVHREPGGDTYANVARFVAGDKISPLADLPQVDVAALLAP
jgi:Uma2 family endonuclease